MQLQQVTSFSPEPNANANSKWKARSSLKRAERDLVTERNRNVDNANAAAELQLRNAEVAKLRHKIQSLVEYKAKSETEAMTVPPPLTLTPNKP